MRIIAKKKKSKEQLILDLSVEDFKEYIKNEKSRENLKKIKQQLSKEVYNFQLKKGYDETFGEEYDKMGGPMITTILSGTGLGLVSVVGLLSVGAIPESMGIFSLALGVVGGMLGVHFTKKTVIYPIVDKKYQKFIDNGEKMEQKWELVRDELYPDYRAIIKNNRNKEKEF